MIAIHRLLRRTPAMSNSRDVKRVGVFGHVGNQNLGDEALVAAVIQSVRRRYSDAEMCAFTINPDDTQKRHKVQAFPIRRIDKNLKEANQPRVNNIHAQKPNRHSKLPERIKVRLKTIPLIYGSLKGIQKILRSLWVSLQELGFLTRCYRNLQGVDLLIIAGSQQCNDYFGGPWAFPYTLFKWSVLAKLAGTKVAFLSVGVGPIESSLGKFFVRRSLRLATYRSYRDERSKRLAEKIGVKGENPVFPDLVYSFPIMKQPAPAGPKLEPTIGVNPFPFCDGRYWVEQKPAVYESYTRKLASFSAWLIERGYTVLFFPTQLRADPPVIEDIRIRMKNNGMASCEGRIAERSVASFEDLFSCISMMDMAVVTRFHAVIFSYLLNKPVLAIAYHEKTGQLMETMGQSEYVLDIDSLELDSLKERFESLESRRNVIEKEIEQRVAACRQALEAQYDQVLRLLED